MPIPATYFLIPSLVALLVKIPVISSFFKLAGLISAICPIMYITVALLAS